MEWTGFYDASSERLEMPDLCLPDFLNASLSMILTGVDDNYVQVGEGLFTKFLYDEEEAEDNITDMSKILWNLKIPLTFLLVLLCGLILAIIGIPLLYWYKKRSKSINALHYQIWFCIESFVLLIGCAFLILSLNVYINIAYQVRSAGWGYPQIIYSLVKCLNTSIDDYKFKSNIINEDIWSMRADMRQDINMLPEKLRQSVHQHLNPHVDSCLGIINQIIAMHSIEGNPQVADYEANDFLNFGCSFLDKSGPLENEFVKQNYYVSKKFIPSASLDNLNLMYETMNVPENMYRKFQVIFMDELDRLRSAISSNIIHVNITNSVASMLEQFREPLNYINAATEFIEAFTARNIIQSMPMFWNVSRFDVLIYLPTIYCSTFLTFLLIGCALSLWTLMRVVAAKDPKKTYKYTSSMFTMALTVGIFFLWLIFTMAIMFYTFFWPLDIICKSEVIQMKYLNKWNETEIYQHIKKDMAISTADLQHIFEACREDKTIIVGLNLVKEAVQNVNIAIDKTEWEKMLNNGLNDADFRNTYVIDQMLTESAQRLAERPQRLAVSKKVEEICESLLAGNYTGSFDEFSGAFLDLVASKWRDNECQEKVVLLKMYKKQLTKHVDSIGTTFHEFVDAVASNLSRSSSSMHLFANARVEKDLGKCYVIPYTYETIKWMVCDHMLLIVLGLCLSLTVMGFSMVVCLFLTLRMLKYLTGAYEHLSFVEQSKHRYSGDNSRRITLRGVKLALMRKMREQKISEDILQ